MIAYVVNITEYDCFTGEHKRTRRTTPFYEIDKAYTFAYVKTLDDLQFFNKISQEGFMRKAKFAPSIDSDGRALTVNAWKRKKRIPLVVYSIEEVEI